MDGWAAVVQAVLLAVATWYVRRGSTEDASRVQRTAADKVQAQDILSRVKGLEADLALVKRAIARDTRPDDRGPARR